MYQIQQITSDPLQNMTIILPTGTQSLSMTLYYVPLQYSWFITNFVYGSFTLQGLRISNSPNLLNQYINQIPFGLACYTTANREPNQQQDFLSQAAILYILTAAECQEYYNYLSSGVL
jgi:hypothetical protein